MDYMIYGHCGHGSTWRLCCDTVGAMPIRCYNEKRAEYYRQRHIKTDELSKRYDIYNIGDRIEHPKFGLGIIEEVIGESVNRLVVVNFQNIDSKRFGLAWIDSNCKKV